MKKKKQNIENRKQKHTFPAIGTLKGSVQNTALFISCMSDAFTAKASCIGRSEGTTLRRVGVCCRLGNFWEFFEDLEEFWRDFWGSVVQVIFFRFRMSRRVVLLDITSVY
jgi:hypothetical protein